MFFFNDCVISLIFPLFFFFLEMIPIEIPCELIDKWNNILCSHTQTWNTPNEWLNLSCVDFLWGILLVWKKNSVKFWQPGNGLVIFVL